MTTYARRADENQREIVQALRQCGATVQTLHTVGHGCPDLLVSRAGVNYLLECKIPGAKLTDDETAWHAEWRGQVAIVRNAEEAIAAITAT